MTHLKNQIFALLAGLCSFAAVPGHAQENVPAWKPFVAGQMFAGGEISTHAFYFNSGTGVQLGMMRNVSGLLDLGAGIGFDKAEHEVFTPIFAELRGRLRPQGRTGMILAQAGLSPVFSNRYDDLLDYTLKGGGFAAIGWGYAWPLKRNNSAFISVMYRQQQGTLTYNPEGGPEVIRQINYSFLMLRAGINL